MWRAILSLRGSWARRGAGVVSLFAVAAIVLQFGLLGGARLTGDVGVVPRTTASGTPCDSLVANSTLVHEVTSNYPNGSLLPTESSADASVQEIWGNVCTSATFVADASAHSNLSFGQSVFVGAKNVTGSGAIVGSLFVQFTAGWTASCPTRGGPYPAGYPCDYSDAWVGNLTTGVIVTPARLVYSARLPCPSILSNASIAGTLAGFYPTPGLQPSEPVAVANAEAAWWAICSSAAFYENYTGHNQTGIMLSTWQEGAGLGPNGTGAATLYMGVDFEWPEPVAPAGYPSGYGCLYDESWAIHLTNGYVAGPTVTIYSDAEFSGPPPIVPLPGTWTTR